MHFLIILSDVPVRAGTAWIRKLDGTPMVPA